jgi:RNA polymerase sigma factor (sigma-70 family)
LRLRSDATLGERFAGGDETAFAVLYERHRATVLAVCIGVLGSRHDAEDALQDCFAALARALKVRPPRELRPWLIRVARNAAIDIARRRRSGEYAGDEALDRAAPPDPAPAELQAVLQGIRELPESQRTALLMRELAGRTYREIADSLQIEEDAVRGLIARARIGLRDHRAASELPCEQARDALAVDPHHRPGDRTVRRHVKSCAGCQAYARMLRDDAKALRGLMPVSGGSIAAGSAIAGGIGAKGALLGGALSQAGAACAVSVCAVGGMALVAPKLPVLGTAHRSSPAVLRVSAGHPSRTEQQRRVTLQSASHASTVAFTLVTGVTAVGAGSAAEPRRLSGLGIDAGGSSSSATSRTSAESGHPDRLTATTTGSRLSAAGYGSTQPRSPSSAGPSPTPGGPDAGGSDVGGSDVGGSGAGGSGGGTPSGAQAAPASAASATTTTTTTGMPSAH